MGDAFGLVAVGTDGSPPSMRAVERAAMLAADGHSELVILCVYRPDDRADTTSDASRPGAIKTSDVVESEQALHGDAVHQVVGAGPAEDVLRRARERATQAGASLVDTQAVSGRPADGLIDAAGSRGADLVVVGNRGLHSLTGRVLGSVPQTVARHAHSDVLIVHTT